MSFNFKTYLCQKKFFSNGKHKKTSGQSAIELALILPIAMFLLWIIFNAFYLHDQASQEHILEHEVLIKNFDNGNGTITLGPNIIPVNELEDLLPYIPDRTLLDGLVDTVTSVATEWGLNYLFNNVDFFKSDTILSGISKGAITSTAHQLVNNGINEFSFESVAWAGATGGLSTREMSQFLQGADYTKSNFQEAFGSSLQYAAIGFTSSQGDWNSAAMGAVAGLNSSDTLKSTEGKKFEPLVGAAKGALQATVHGALHGQVDEKSILRAAGLGAFNTQTVASTLPLSQNKQSMMFSATSAALNAWSQDKKDTKNILKAGLVGALGSSQSQVKSNQAIQAAYKELGIDMNDPVMSQAALAALRSAAAGEDFNASSKAFFSFAPQMAFLFQDTASMQDIETRLLDENTINATNLAIQEQILTEQLSSQIQDLSSVLILDSAINSDDFESSSGSNGG